MNGRRKSRSAEASPANERVPIRAQMSPEQEQAWRRKMLLELYEEGASPDFIYAFEKTGNYITPENRDEWSKAELEEWDGLLRAYERRFSLEDRIIDLAFRLPRSGQHSELGRQKAIAASEFGIATSTAHELGMSSFVVEQTFREIWLDSALRPSRAPDYEWDPTDHHRFDHIDMRPIQSLLSALCQETANSCPDRELGIEARKPVARIAEARAAEDTWFGKPSAPDTTWIGNSLTLLRRFTPASANARKRMCLRMSSSPCCCAPGSDSCSLMSKGKSEPFTFWTGPGTRFMQGSSSPWPKLLTFACSRHLPALFFSPC